MARFDGVEDIRPLKLLSLAEATTTGAESGGADSSSRACVLASPVFGFTRMGAEAGFLTPGSEFAAPSALMFRLMFGALLSEVPAAIRSAGGLAAPADGLPVVTPVVALGAKVGAEAGVVMLAESGVVCGRVSTGADVGRRVFGCPES